VLYSIVPVFSANCIWVLHRLPLSPSPLFSLPRAAAAAPAKCAAPAAPAPLCARPRALPRPTAAFPDPVLVTPCPRHVARRLPEPRFTAARRRSDSSATSCFRRSHASLTCLAAALPTLCWPALTSSTSHCLCLSSAAVATRAADAPAPASTRSRLVLDPEHILESLTHSFLRCTHTFSLNFPCSDYRPHRTSTVPPDHRRPTPTPPLNPNPVQP
jgi:hypothetical protein